MSQYPKVRLANETTRIGQWANKFFDFVLAPLFRLRPFQNAYSRAMQDPSNTDLWTKTLKELKTTFTISPQDIERIPKEGGVVIVVNHPHGIMDGVILGSLLHQIRDDYKIIMNEATSMPGLDDNLYFVAIFGTAKENAKKNMQIMRDAIEWLENGHAVLLFPSGEISAIKSFEETWARDNTWSNNLIRLSLRSQTPVLPLFIVGQNDSIFLKLGLLHPVFRTMQIGRVTNHLLGENMTVRAAHPIQVKLLESLPDDEARLNFVRSCTYALQAREIKPAREFASTIDEVTKTDVSESTLHQAFDLLLNVPDFMVRDSDTYSVLIFNQQQLLDLNPENAVIFTALKDEIGRQRELTFREVGEGSGLLRDLDAFDDYYSHLTLWDKPKKRLIGAYRIGFTQEIIAKYGIAGLYTATQYDFNPEFFKALGQAAEVSRAFIIKDYQKSPVSLSMLLGSMSQVLIESGIQTFFGVVSMSNEFQPISKKLMLEYLLKHHGHSEFSAWVTPKNPPQFDLKMSPHEWQRIVATVSSMSMLNAMIASIEEDGKTIPPLIPIYLSLTGRIIAFDQDTAFNSTDGLLVLNLHDAINHNPSLVKRLVGKQCFERCTHNVSTQNT
ncbi:MAG: GNAT family N-acyltransferase, partial [Gammaproteobacteria bacterium]